jgi:hypothetical protein
MTTDTDEYLDELKDVGRACGEAALRYAEIGLAAHPICNSGHVGVGSHHVKKCTKPGKSPVITEWQTAGCPTVEELVRWWNEAPLCNVGIRLGRGIVRIDADGDKAKEKLDAISGGDFPQTWTYQRGDSLPQYLYAIPTGETWNSVTFGLGDEHQELRFQAEGAQAVVPPSLHETGDRYRWLPGCSPFESQLAPAPIWLCTIMRERQKKPHKENGHTDVATLFRVPDQVREEARRLLARLKPSRAVNYDDWIKVGMALHAADQSAEMLALWDAWSQQSAKYQEGECAEKWALFDADKAEGLTFGSLLHWATEDHGVIRYQFSRPHTNECDSAESAEPPGSAPPEQTPDPAPEPPSAPITRKQVVITTEEHAVNNDVVSALAAHPALFKRGNKLVTVLRVETEVTKGVMRPIGAPQIATVSNVALREMSTLMVNFAKYDKKGNLAPAHPPNWCAPQIVERGHWPGIRYLSAIVETPVILEDGRLLDTPGWDESTGILYEPAGRFPPVPQAPTVADAKRAAATLFELVVQFPFKDDCAKAAWLCGVLTPFARFAIPGSCPAVLFDSNVARSGKSKLADLIAVIATGRTMARTAWPAHDDAEIRKSILAIAQAGDRMVLFDNVGEGVPFGGSALEAAITGTTWKGRVLGKSENSTELPLLTLFHASGNNVVLGRAMDGRLILCQLECLVEHPEDRAGWKHPSLIGYATVQRPALAAAALTILRAYILAGMPDQKLVAFGSFEEWQKLVQYAVHWATSTDARGNREELHERNEARNDLGALIAGWEELPGGTMTGLTVSEAVRLLNDNQRNASVFGAGHEPLRYSKLRDLFVSWSGGKEDLNPLKIGNRIRTYRGQIRGGKQLVKAKMDTNANAIAWKVQRT